LAELSDRERTTLTGYLGDPPDPDRIPHSVWADIEHDRRKVLLEILVDAFLDSAEAHGLDREQAESIAFEWARRRAREVAAGYVQTTRDRIATVCREYRERMAAQTPKGSFARSIRKAGWLDFLEGRFDWIAGPDRDGMIATTELTAAVTMGGEAAADMLFGISDEDIWRANPDACDDCMDVDGTPRSYWGTLYPDGPADAHPSCACWLEYAAMPLVAGLKRLGFKRRLRPLAIRKQQYEPGIVATPDGTLGYIPTAWRFTCCGQKDCPGCPGPSRLEPIPAPPGEVDEEPDVTGHVATVEINS
jgi:hypothetical protein